MRLCVLTTVEDPASCDGAPGLDGASLCQEFGTGVVVGWLLVGPGSDLSEASVCGV